VLDTPDDGGPGPLVSVVMPMLDGATTVAAQLEALAAQDFDEPWELVVADNGSNDTGPAIVEEWRIRLPSLTVVDASAHRGVSHARSSGVRAARADLIAICDCDDVVSTRWLRSMYDALQHFDLVGGRLDPDLLNDEWSLAGRPTPAQSELPVAGHFLPYAVGANVGIRREVFDALGGWSNAYLHGGDDVDFSWRAQLEGFALGYGADAVIHYRHRSDLAAVGRQYYRYAVMQAQLYRDFRAAGMQRPNTRTVVLGWLWLLHHLPVLWGSRDRTVIWVRKAAERFGHVAGSIRSRVLYL